MIKHRTYGLHYGQRYCHTNLSSLVAVKSNLTYYQKSSSLEEYCSLPLLSLSDMTFVVGSILASDSGWRGGLCSPSAWNVLVVVYCSKISCKCCLPCVYSIPVCMPYKQYVVKFCKWDIFLSQWQSLGGDFWSVALDAKWSVPATGLAVSGWFPVWDAWYFRDVWWPHSDNMTDSLNQASV